MSRMYSSRYGYGISNATKDECNNFEDETCRSPKAAAHVAVDLQCKALIE